ncbi:MAG: hypothetical protein M3P11_11115 [Actinomycetota bacterium]|nr:hypothetical protein [Actinomycetota bacterium]
MTDRTEDHSSERRPIRVAIRNEDIEDVSAHGYRMGLGQTDDTEGQIYMMTRHREDDPDHVEGQMPWSRLEPADPDDVEGQASRYGLRPAEPDEVEGHGSRYGVLKPEEDGTWTVELDDDTEGHANRF